MLIYEGKTKLDSDEIKTISKFIQDEYHTVIAFHFYEPEGFFEFHGLSDIPPYQIYKFHKLIHFLMNFLEYNL